MRAIALTQIVATTSLCVSTFLCAQSHPSQPSPATTSTLPSTAPTTTPAVSVPAAPLTPAQSPAQRAQISYVDSKLTVSASNSSLNQILREISRLTGLQITGGVAEERVFGNYGPASTSEVLRTLLDGTSSNVLIVQGNGSTPSELILTPRTGGPTPPNPNAARFDETADDQARSPRNILNRPPPPPSESQSTPAAHNASPQPVTPSPADNNSDNSTTTAPSSSDSNQQSPNGVKTPQQIFEQLQQLRQQQQSQPQ